MRTDRFKSAEVKIIVKESQDAIKIYQIGALLEQARYHGFSDLKDSQKECLIAGLIKLGEALTFCRDKENKLLSDIRDFALQLADIRNHLVHHQLYHTYLDNPYEKMDEKLKSLPSIDNLTVILEELNTSGLTKLSKPITKGKNNYLFDYSHYLHSLEQEFSKLHAVMKETDPKELADKIDSDIEVKATLENRCRNILAILVDLTDADLINQNYSNSCKEEKQIAQTVNYEIVKRKEGLAVLFDRIKEFRNALCHLDDTLSSPYTNTNELIIFLGQLIQLHEIGYAGELRKKLEQTVSESRESQSKGIEKSATTPLSQNKQSILVKPRKKPDTKPKAKPLIPKISIKPKTTVEKEKTKEEKRKFSSLTPETKPQQNTTTEQEKKKKSDQQSQPKLVDYEDSNEDQTETETEKITLQ